MPPQATSLIMTWGMTGVFVKVGVFVTVDVTGVNVSVEVGLRVGVNVLVGVPVRVGVKVFVGVPV